MLEFEKITRFILDRLDETIIDLQDEEKIEQDTEYDHAFKFKLFDNYGEYSNKKKAEYMLDKNKKPITLGVIYSSVGVQDTGIAVPVNLQIIKLELVANVTQMKDMKVIFDNLCLNMRSLNAIIDNEYVRIDCSEFPEYSEPLESITLEDSIEDLRVFTIGITLNVTEYGGCVLSDNVALKVNDVVIPYDTMNVSRTYDKQFDTSEKREEALAFINTTQNVYTFSMFYTNNQVVQQIAEDIIANNYFGQLWKIDIVKDGRSILTKQMVIIDGKVSLAHGQIASIEVSFMPGISL